MCAAATMKLLVQHLKRGGKIAIFDFKKSEWSNRCLRETGASGVGAVELRSNCGLIVIDHIQTQLDCLLYVL